MNFFSIILLSFFKNIQSFDLCVIGATSGLGKELVYQAALDRNISVLALSGTSKMLTIPCRENSFQEINNQPPFNNPNVHRDNYWNDLTKYDYKNIVFTTSSSPFKDDYSDKLLAKIIVDLPKSCENLVLISAYGVGNSLNEKEIGINIMNNWYLKDVYRAKNTQEKILNLDIIKKKHSKLNINIIRPKALSYGKTIVQSTSRQVLANNILNNII